jgi:hypothetical protein
MYLSAALTGDITMNITAPIVGCQANLCFIQGGTARTVTLSMTGVVWRQTNTTNSGTATIIITASTVSANYKITLLWATATLCYVSLQ